jgi:hypothetical protein
MAECDFAVDACEFNSPASSAKKDDARLDSVECSLASNLIIKLLEMLAEEKGNPIFSLRQCRRHGSLQPWTSGQGICAPSISECRRQGKN